MKTDRLFKDNVYLKETRASVTSVSQRNGKTLITLDKTIFFPTGGGQSCDLGQIGKFQVEDVYEYEDEIYHQVDCDPCSLQPGLSVDLKIDWQRRFDNMQRQDRKSVV